MKKYYYSIVFHIIAVLLLLSIGRWEIAQHEVMDQVIIIDFGDHTDTKKMPTRPHESNAVKRKISKKAPSTKHQKSKLTPSSQKSKGQAESTDVATEAKMRSTLVQEQAAQLAELQLAEVQRQKKKDQAEAEKVKAKKLDYFKTMIDNSVSKSKEYLTKKDIELEEQSIPTSSLSKDYSLSGAISNRSVLKKPIIIDKTQKEGRVIVKICVDASGKVISSKYTQIGSTTTDAHLIMLSEKGALEYLFSESDLSKQCGRVLIDFTIRA